MLVLIYQTWHKGAVRMNHSLLYHSLPAADKELNSGFDSKKKIPQSLNFSVITFKMVFTIFMFYDVFMLNVLEICRQS